uniref:Histidine--tRNA ligase, chloroplastic n=1 Tax=Gracilariopsis heteroclada TaxID=172978 RepID=A0A344V6G1_9FLOR|nr:histidine-tRNA synthetase [Gracilariopsis heteroclada]AXE43548.1 histidine-tRNA synthetase [Gracilariopsis heteroclada]
MQPLRGTKDILPDEIIYWQYIYNKALDILSLHNYKEIRTPILESTELFERSIGETTDIINKEMYNFKDQGGRNITLRPEGTASIARAFINHKMYQKTIQRLWYYGPMFRYERPQNGRQRQFHQLGIECIGSLNPMADAEVIHLAHKLLNQMKLNNCVLEINSIGNLEEREKYQADLIEYLKPYTKDLDQDSQKRLNINPLRILDSKNIKTQEILYNGPSLNKYLKKQSIDHFNLVCAYLDSLQIQYNINHKLVRGLDYYNYTAFEIKTKLLGAQNTICGGGRYDTLIKQLGGPETPAVGWAIGLERLLQVTQQQLHIQDNHSNIYIITQGIEAQKKIWQIVKNLENEKINFELDLSNTSLKKQIKRAIKSGAELCILVGEDEIINNCITIKILNKHKQYTIPYENLLNEIHQLLVNKNRIIIDKK